MSRAGLCCDMKGHTCKSSSGEHESDSKLPFFVTAGIVLMGRISRINEQDYPFVRERSAEKSCDCHNISFGT